MLPFKRFQSKARRVWRGGHFVSGGGRRGGVALALRTHLGLVGSLRVCNSGELPPDSYPFGLAAS